MTHHRELAAEARSEGWFCGTLVLLWELACFVANMLLGWGEKMR